MKIPLVRTSVKNVPKANIKICLAMCHVSNVMQVSTRRTKVRPIVCHAYREDIKTTIVPLIANIAPKDNTNIFPAMCRASIALQVGT